ncbi:hypothetical protein [Kitasatospora sp. NPDC092286]|uniref:hypothetical protein n=1 Tax=Kitasatospora sp. NPDC092286 TaxID=3364087 RepID=UPI00380AEC9E
MPPAGDVLTRNQAASLLGLSPNTVTKLLNSDFLPDLRASRVLALSRAPQVTVTTGYLPVLRTAAAAPPADPAEDPRPFLGDSATISDLEFLEANRMWWRCDAERIVQAGVLAIAVAGWVTGVLSIHAREDSRVGRTEIRHSFKAEVAGRVGLLDDPNSYRVLATDPALATLTGQLLGARVQAAVSGGPIAYLEP